MKLQKWERQFKKIIRNPSAYGLRECTLCGREVISFVGVCFPEKKLAERLQTPPGKWRTVFYALCEECASEGQKAADRVEEALTDELDKGVPINLLK
jgi:hypothetical protein